MNFLRHISLIMGAAVACCLMVTGMAMAAETGKAVAILPFTLNAPPDKQYLQEGLRDMLGSRIRTEAGAEILPRQKVDALLRENGGRLVARNMASFAGKAGADYLVFGSISSLGAGISIDAQVFSAAAPAAGAVQSFYGSAVTNDQIMRAIDTLAWDIIEALFNKKRPTSMVQVPRAQDRNAGVSGFATAHPEKTFMKSGGNYGIRSGRNFVRTRNFEMGIRSIELADVDGDGREEVILADKREVRVFDRDGTRLNAIGTVRMPARYLVHNVNAADLNGNGRAEIYISAADPELPGSRAVEWDGEKFADLFREARWYLRPMEVPGAGLVLVGQKAGMIPVEPGIYQLAVHGGKVTAQERLPVPSRINLFNFVYADLDGSGSPQIVALDGSFKLLVLKGGSVVWKSEERFCGTRRFVGGSPDMMPGTSAGRNDIVDGVGEMYRETYIPSRILVADVDSDGVDDLILNRNPDSLAVAMPRSRHYASGTLVGLKWNGLGLEEMWRTRKIDGYVVDYQVKSHAVKVDRDQGDELFIGIILNSGTFDSLLGDMSTVVMYPFDFEQPETN